jgi:hypothetical protein
MNIELNETEHQILDPSIAHCQMVMSATGQAFLLPLLAELGRRNGCEYEVEPVAISIKVVRRSKVVSPAYGTLLPFTPGGVS